MTTTKRAIDPAHSELRFKVNHLMISNVSGFSQTFGAAVETEVPDFSKANITLTVQMASITSNNEQRNTHLRTSDFFDVERYPEMIFQSIRIERVVDDDFALQGDLRLEGVTKSVKLSVEFRGVAKNLWGGERAGFTVSGKVNRKDWGVNYNAVLETGGVAVSEEIKIYAEIQLDKQALAVAA